MSRWDKLIQKILSLSRDVTFEDIKKVLESYGYEGKTPGGGSSHYTFRKEGYKSLTIPKHNKVNIAYIKMVKRVIEEESKNAYS